MTPPNPTDAWIPIDDLRVGMFVHLDMSWMSHPFPLGSFKIGSPAQIDTIRSLGKDRLRWDPERSDLAVPESNDGQPPYAEAPGDAPQPQEAAGAAAACEPAGPHRAGGAARASRAGRLPCDRRALEHGERQYGEAQHDLRQTLALVAAQPLQAGEQAVALAGALRDKMLVAGDLHVRLLGEATGDRASGHALNVAILSMLLGRGFGLAGEELAELGAGALLHDVGKLDLPERVRHGGDHLTPSEQAYYREHVALGVAQGRRMGLSAGVLAVIAQHHEQADGLGFPQGLNVDRMSAAARIVALVNRYDRLCNPQLPSRAMTPHEALSLLFAQSQRQFDTTMLSAFIKMMGVYPLGSTVQLTDDRFALVVGVNSTRPLRPTVLVYDEQVPRDEAGVLDLEQVAGLGIRRSVRPRALPREVHAWLAPRTRLSYYFETAEPAAESAPPVRRPLAAQAAA
jgi:putative nucleotidyltransferase with HDIG domain